MFTAFWLEKLRGRVHLEDLGVDKRKISEWFLEKHDRKVRTEFIWLRISSSSGLS
jgi:hypothetical protein